MKNFILIITITTTLFSCSNEDSFNNTSGIYGKWKLIATKIDIGNGQATFKSVNSNKTITFLNNKTFTSTDDQCNMGYFTIGDNVINNNQGKIIPENCPNMYDDKIEYLYEISGNELIIYYYGCIEGCSAKYIKTENSTTTID